MKVNINVDGITYYGNRFWGEDKNTDTVTVSTNVDSFGAMFFAQKDFHGLTPISIVANDNPSVFYLPSDVQSPSINAIGMKSLEVFEFNGTWNDGPRIYAHDEVLPSIRINIWQIGSTDHMYGDVFLLDVTMPNRSTPHSMLKLTSNYKMYDLREFFLHKRGVPFVLDSDFYAIMMPEFTEEGKPRNSPRIDLLCNIYNAIPFEQIVEYNAYQTQKTKLKLAFDKLISFNNKYENTLGKCTHNGQLFCTPLGISELPGLTNEQRLARYKANLTIQSFVKQTARLFEERRTQN